MRLWAEMFARDDVALVAAAVKALIESDSKGFPPHIGAVKENMRLISGGNEMTEAEADMPAPANATVDGTAGYSLTASDFSRAAAVRALESAIPNAVSRVSVSTAAMAPAGADASTSTVAINALWMEMEGLRRDLNGIKVVMDGRTVGRMVTKQQNNIGRAFGTA